MHRRKVDFPLPEGPIMTTTSPFLMVVEMPLMTLRGPKFLCKSSMTKSGSSEGVAGRESSGRVSEEVILESCLLIRFLEMFFEFTQEPSKEHDEEQIDCGDHEEWHIDVVGLATDDFAAFGQVA